MEAKKNINPQSNADAEPASLGNGAIAPEEPVGTRNPIPNMKKTRGIINVYKLNGTIHIFIMRPTTMLRSPKREPNKINLGNEKR